MREPTVEEIRAYVDYTFSGYDQEEKEKIVKELRHQALFHNASHSDLIDLRIVRDVGKKLLEVLKNEQG